MDQKGSSTVSSDRVCSTWLACAGSGRSVPAICSQENRAQCGRWMCDVGLMRCGPTTRTESIVATVASRAQWHNKDESTRKKLFLVAQVRCRDRGNRQRMCHMPRTPQLSSTSATSPREWPSRPWQRLHIDYAGPFMGHMFLIVMDAHTKWMDAYPVTSATSVSTIECLRKSFSNWGLPETIVSDNGSCFVSAEFKEFLQRNGIEYLTSAPYHPSSNGCAERAVQTFKAMMKKV